ncbi:RNA polymerase sigma factor [Flaviaesturariibacter amylovorans]|uniref:RNA polymerase sigma factor n=1 Tax=Flaviaesturariibacter amylovorans TaxID=1084520 RepID=A0ABP8HM08_9BACT
MSSEGHIQLVDHLFRHEAGKMVAVLAARFGLAHLQLAEDAVQDAFVQAGATWRFGQLPADPAAWLMRTAANRAIDLLRREGRWQRIQAGLSDSDTEAPPAHYHGQELADAQLQMIFACCHPALKPEDGIALTLKTVSGFSAAEIARALMSSEAALQKRLARARSFLREEGIRLEIPAGPALRTRLDRVYTVLYLLFNEGYHSTKADEPIRRDLCGEAMRCCKLLVEHPAVRQPAAFALLALMCFHAARFDARLTSDNELILLAGQDRTLWDQELIAVGRQYLNEASRGTELSRYHLEAAIAAEHCAAPRFNDTCWPRLLVLYDHLAAMCPTPAVRLARAVVLAETGDIAGAIGYVLATEGIETLLRTQYLFPAILGDLYKRLSETVKARALLEQACALTPSPAERHLLQAKLETLRN